MLPTYLKLAIKLMKLNGNDVMKLNKNFVIQDLCEETFMIPVGNESDKFKGIVKLNETASFLVNKVKDKEFTRDDLIEDLSLEYEGNVKEFEESVDKLISTLKRINAIIE